MRTLDRIEAAVAGTFLVLMVVLIFAGGIARLLHHPLNWTTDVATCLFAWACFLCADVAWRRDTLMSVDLLTVHLPPGVRRAVTYCNLAIIALFLVFLIGSGLWLSYVSSARTFQGIPGVSYSWVTMSLPVGATLLLLTTVRRARREMRGATARAAAPAAGEETSPC
ncbi:MAG TPA: TRAP transporter small permease [Azospirillum sp.]|nr:TRAP transporter small permease [Azospirillum sp.]